MRSSFVRGVRREISEHNRRDGCTKLKNRHLGIYADLLAQSTSETVPLSNCKSIFLAAISISSCQKDENRVVNIGN